MWLILPGEWVYRDFPQLINHFNRMLDNNNEGVSLLSSSTVCVLPVQGNPSSGQEWWIWRNQDMWQVSCLLTLWQTGLPQRSKVGAAARWARLCASCPHLLQEWECPAITFLHTNTRLAGSWRRSLTWLTWALLSEQAVTGKSVASGRSKPTKPTSTKWEGARTFLQLCLETFPLWKTWIKSESKSGR